MHPYTAPPRPTPRRRLLAWLAAFAWLLAALAPAVSQTLASRRGGPDLAFAICSSTGSATTLALSQAGQAATDGTGRSTPSAFEACAYCLLQHQQQVALGMPIARPAWALRDAAHERPQIHTPRAGAASAVWAPSARGPPTQA